MSHLRMVSDDMLQEVQGLMSHRTGGANAEGNEADSSQKLPLGFGETILTRLDIFCRLQLHACMPMDTYTANVYCESLVLQGS